MQSPSGSLYPLPCGPEYHIVVASSAFYEQGSGGEQNVHTAPLQELCCGCYNSTDLDSLEDTSGSNT